MTTEMNTRPSPHLSQDAARRRQGRQRTEVIFQTLGIGALVLAAALLVWLVWGIFDKARYGLTQHMMQVEVYLDPEPFDHLKNDDGSINWSKRKTRKDTFYRQYLAQSVRDYLPGLTEDEASEASILFSDAAAWKIRDGLRYGDYQLGETIKIWALMDDVVDVWSKGVFPTEAVVAQSIYAPEAIELMQQLKEAGALQERLYLGFPRLNLEIWLPFIGVQSWEVSKGSPGFLTSPNSANPEMAGLGRAFQGTLLMLLVVIVVAVPLGVAAAVYLEEFAPKNRFTDLIEININNLAAVPSIIFGVLGLGVLVNMLFPFARGYPIIGGLVLSFMTLPTVIIASRAAILAVPSSYKEAAIGMGASKMQAVFQHVLPAAIPGIVSGVIIGIAQAAGETAPLLPIGLKSFITSSCEKGLACLFEPGTAMPAQIFFWAENAERLFKYKANAAIIVLLIMILGLNAIATYIRWRAEQRK